MGAVTKMSNKKQIISAVIFGCVVIAFLGGVKFFQIRKAMANQFTPPPSAVTTVIAEETVWKASLTSVGSLVPVQGAIVSAEEAGKVVKVSFESGASVKAGDLLVEMDTTVEEGNLQAALSRLDQAKRSFVRAKELLPTKAMSAEGYEVAESKFRQAEGEVESLKGMIARKRITAPFAGRLGIRKVNVGQYVTAGVPLVPLHALETLYINFSLPQRDLPQVALGQDIEIVFDEKVATVFDGKVTAINSEVEEATRNFEVQATISNPDEKLRPGMFAKVKVQLGEEKKVIAIPSSSIAYAPFGNTVYVVENMKGPDGSEYLGVRQQIVMTGEKRGELVAIVSGVKPGEQIVTSGWQKLRPAAPVSINNNFTPGNSTNPHPSDS